MKFWKRPAERAAPIGLRASQLLAAALSLTISACVSHRIPLQHDGLLAPCRELIGAAKQTAVYQVEWIELTDPSDRLEMASSCKAVGPAVYLQAQPAGDGTTNRSIGRFAVLSWNVHVGGGDLMGVLSALRRGDLTAGVPVDEFVVLVQEAFRRGGAVPAIPPGSGRIPRRIAPTPPRGPRQDILEVAGALGLSVFYLPSMRNGSAGGPSAEDRGNAILSTRALDELVAIELPFERQRRVAVAATVAGVNHAGQPWRLRFVSAHLNATASIRRLWVFAAAARARQARNLAAALSKDDVPTLIGADLNVWAGGSSEPAFRKLHTHFPQTPDPGAERRMMLDYVFMRMPAEWIEGVDVLEDRFGSDHRPVLARLDFNVSASQSQRSKS